MRKPTGFTIIELIVVISFISIATILLFYQKSNLMAANRDTARKIAINAMYYNLEEVFFEKNHYYPETINSKILKAMDPQLFVDPNGRKLGESGSDYRYDSTGCVDERCQGYTLIAHLEKESDFIKTNRNK